MVLLAIAINQRIPVINYAASGYDKSQRDPDSTLFSVYGDMSELISEVVPELMAFFDWKRFTTLTVKGETHTNYVTKLKDPHNNLDASNQEIIDEIRIIQSALDTIKENHRIIWIDVKMTIFAKIMCEAYEKGV